MKPKPKSSTMEVHVPHDVISNNILPRIPAKSVGRFMRVSKEWHSFLTSDMFKNKHSRHVHEHKNNLKLLVVYKTETSFEFITIDCEAPTSDKGLTPTRRPLPQFGDTTPDHIHILTSFHGLVCLGIIKDKHDIEYSDLVFWNPLTSEYKTLSKSYSHKECNNIWDSCSVFELYYSCCEDDYKLLFVNLLDDNVNIYSLKSDSWRKVDVFHHTSHSGSWSRGTYLNENLYFLKKNLTGRVDSIIRFDTKTELLSKIETPNVDHIPWSLTNYNATIVVKSDCIHVCVKYDMNAFRSTTWIKLWKLDEYGNMKEVVTYQLRPYEYDNIISYLIPYHLMKNGNLLMLKNWWTSYNHRIYKVDLKEKEKGNIYDDFEYVNVRMDNNTNIKNLVSAEVRYIETFVSLNRYMK